MAFTAFLAVVVAVNTASAVDNNLSIQKLGRNISRGETGELTSIRASRGDTLEFILKVRSNSSANLNNVIIRDALPSGLAIVENTTSLNNVVTSDGIAGPGINIGILQPGQEAIVRFNATISSDGSFVNTAYAHSDATGEASSQLPVAIAGEVRPTVTNVQTGAGSNALIVVIGATILSFLYMRYTQTGIFRLREATGVAKDTRSDKSKFNFA